MAEIILYVMQTTVNNSHFLIIELVSTSKIIHDSSTFSQVQPVKLPEQGQAFESGDAVVSGWGTLHAGDFTLPDLLHVVTVPLVNDAGE